MMRMSPINKDAYKLLHEGTLALADVEEHGLRVALAALESDDAHNEGKRAKLTKDLLKTRDGKLWVRLCNDKHRKWKVNSDAELRVLLFGIRKYDVERTTEKGQPAVDDDTLRAIGTDFTKTLLQLRKLQKVSSTYLGQLRREAFGGYLHPFFSLGSGPEGKSGGARTYRSSSSNPNFQNMPIRDPEQGQVVRSKIYPRPGHRLGEIDYSGLEVRFGVPYHHDPTMIKYITDPTTDMHRDMAIDCFMVKAKKDWWGSKEGKMVRYTAKNGYVFPSFYGSYWAQTAPGMWKMIKEFKLVTPDGVPLTEHLRDMGIKELGTKESPRRGTFMAHIRDVEDHFWRKRFAVYAQWKKDWYAAYLKKGYFDTLTGFRCQGVMGRNDCINYPVQGSAFHCLLWSLIHLNRWLKKERMDTWLVGQIHDSMLPDFHPDEVVPVIKQARQIMTLDVRQHWKWINVPLDVEVELAPVDGSWAEKTKYKEEVA